MSEELADDRKAHTGASANGREAVSKVVKPDAVEIGTRPNARPYPRETHQMGALLLTPENVGVALQTREGVEEFEGRCSQGNDLLAGFAVGQPKAATLHIHVLPLERKDLRFPASCQHEEPNTSDGEGVPAVLLGSGQGVAKTSHFLQGQEPLTFLVREPFDTAYRIVRAQTFFDSE
jgi:hypothetical protein